MTVYAVSGLGVRFGDRRVVEGLDFSVAAGECLALVGQSGSGKSQACLAPFGLSAGVAEGSAVLLDQQLVGTTEESLRVVRGRDVGFVYQQPLSALTPHMRIGDQLIENMGSAATAELEQALAEVGLDRPAERLRNYPHQLSGGQRQRVMIAMAIAHNPRLLIADEPTTALDATLRREMLRLIDRLRESRGLAVILVSHDLALVAGHADRVLVMRDGKAIEQGPARSIFSAPATDYARELAAAAPRLDTPAPVLDTPGEVLLDARDISVSFKRPGWRKGRIAAVKEASLQIREGEAVALVGGSGSGKSTLARAISFLIPRDRGEIVWRGRNLGSRRTIAFADRRAVQIVAQDPADSLDPLWRASRTIAEGAEPLKPGAVAADRIGQLLEEVGLDRSLALRKPGQLSGGQAQRVAIARALAANPDLLVCDEATSALDVTVQAQVVELLRTLQQERGLALLFISHDLALVKQLCHRIVVMDGGRIVEDGPALDVLANPRSEVTRTLIEASA